MKATLYSHCAGREAVPAAVQREIVAAISQVDVPIRAGAARTIRAQLLAAIKSVGWSSEVAVARGSDMTITSMKDGIGLCLQTGNMARMYADLIKLQTLYLDNGITAAIFIIPSQQIALSIGDNIAQASRLQRELEIFRKAYHVPTLLFALECP
jgi:hypothetical protein